MNSPNADPSEQSVHPKRRAPDANLTGTSWRPYYSYAIDVLVSDGDPRGNEDGQPTVRHQPAGADPCSLRQAPALVYMGSTKDGKKALMMLVPRPSGDLGDAKCVLGSDLRVVGDGAGLRRRSSMAGGKDLPGRNPQRSPGQVRTN